MPRLLLSLLLSLGLASSASAVVIDWATVLDQGNACDPQVSGCFGAVPYGYDIAMFEVTNAQYAEFLNAKAKSDPRGLYNTSMGSDPFGGITRTGLSGNFTYTVISGREDMPVNFVSWYDSLRFANWLHNGQGSGDTETGAYTLLGGTPVPSNASTIARNVGPGTFLASENEWYKAAFYGGPVAGYFDYPAGSDTEIGCDAPSATANRANCNDAVFALTITGSYTGSPSPYGTFDQGGNVWEWNEALLQGSSRGTRGGSYASSPTQLSADGQSVNAPTLEGRFQGFRVVSLPEPGTGARLLAIAGLLGLAGWRRVRD